MRGLPLVVAYVALGTALAAGGSLVLPVRSAANAIVVAASIRETDNADPGVVSRLADHARIEARLADARPPVPMLPSHKPAFVPIETPATAEQTVAVLRPPESAARSIEADGYRRVRLLGQEADGRWRALALRGATEVAILVDDQGNVSIQ